MSDHHDNRDAATPTATPAPAATPKITLVTGANRGLGKEAALHLAAAGQDLLLTYRSHAEEIEAVLAAVRGLGRTAVAFRLDTTEFGSFPGFAADVRAALAEHWGRDTFDHLFNNAGSAAMAPVAETTAAQLDSMYEVHFKGPYLLTQTLLPLLADGGRVLNVSTGLTRFTQSDAAPYAAMKGAVEVFTRYLAKELGPRGIAVNAIAPGATGTDFGGGYLRDSEQVREGLASVIAMGHVGDPVDIGAAVASLLADGTRWITGQRIEASGGMLL
ncbi:SDR family NAD(P)-dependent oxidoreductase [Streptomyces sp. NPDC088923]|uniref:SDR family NAD(P)-dependent oxidoreductase n=1 Tax=Streptomyces sp. NPDC088923 TaxID=3365913 RepID=UPI0038077538